MNQAESQDEIYRFVDTRLSDTHHIESAAYYRDVSVVRRLCLEALKDYQMLLDMCDKYLLEGRT